MRFKDTPKRRFSIISQKRFVPSPLRKKRKRFRRHKPGFRVRQEIRREYSSERFCIPKQCFARLTKEIIQHHPLIDRITGKALQALQQATEYHLASLFRFTNECAAHANRVTIQPCDLQLAKQLVEKQTQTILSCNPNASVPKAVKPHD